MTKSKILTLGYVPMGTGRHAPFDHVFQKAVEINPVKPETFVGVDAIVVWGGADISPTIYNQPVSTYTGASSELSARDTYEYKSMLVAIAKDIPIIGVCRGAQMACAVAGGKLVQHVTGHHRDHEIITANGQTMVTSSVHHQMMYPWDVEHDLIAWSRTQQSDAYIGGDDKPIRMPEGSINPTSESIMEPEIVYFPSIRALAIQGHPEFMNEDEEFVKYCNQLVQQYLLDTVKHG